MEASRAPRGRAVGLTWTSAALTSILIVLVVGVLSFGFFALAPGSNSVSASFIHAQPGSIHWNGRDRLNVLLLGIDGARTQQANTDSMMLASYDPASRSLDLLSLPASMWVMIPGFGQGRLAEAYGDGGARLALLVAQSVTHLVIPYYVAMGGTASQQVVDAYGGITLPDANAPHGVRHLDGAGMLSYLRASAGDMDRMVRDRLVFLTFQHQALQPQALFQVASVVNAVGRSISTNFPYDQVPVLAHSLAAVPRSRVHSVALDGTSGAVTAYTTSGEQVLLPDWQQIHHITSRMFVDTALRSGPVDVLNGSGVPGQAQSLSSWLGQMGLHVAHFGSADSFNYPTTLVVENTAARTGNDQLARATASLLQAPLVRRSVRSTVSPIVVIIGHDFQDLGQQ